ncbi:hypothetical protein IV53_GL000403 [Ligilactobacillus ceti DSM 22408]|uniref:Glycosyltransferase n=2 Tax=Ligilactobacillus TaxID=2767887 RepID=A0A0R2KPV1_9LACO|nr:hypothetical protein IV53_GL000403 [Ligilactobacillus ceti DSM 22408]
MGGAETLVKEYALKIDKNQFDLTIVCLDNMHSPWDEMLKKNGIKVIYISDYQKRYTKKDILSRAYNKIQRYYLVKKILRQLSPDVLHYHLSLSDYVLYAKLRKNTNIFYTQHFQFENISQKNKNYLKKVIARYPVTIIALDNEMKQELITELNYTNVVVLNNGIDIAKFQCVKNRDLVRKELGIPADAFVVGHVGRFSEVKNHKFIIEIFEKLVEINPNAFLLLVGAGEKEYEIKNMLETKKLDSKSMMLTNRTDIPDLLNIVDKIIFPSISEGISVALIEMQIAGKICIISDTIPKETAISNLLYPLSLEKDAKYWANVVNNYIVNDVIYTDLEAWDMVSIVEKLEKMYIQAIENTKARERN